jgi:transglutaminase-like putative cysteine protease/glutamine cyclotransferase
MRKKYLDVLLIIFLSFIQVQSQPGRLLESFNTPYSSPAGLTFDGKFLWIADFKADKLSCVNPETGEIIKEISSPGFWPAGLAWDGESLWNVDRKKKKICKINPEDGSIIFVIDAPSENPEGLTWDGNTLWVCDSKSKEIMKIDMSDGTAIEKFTAPANSAQGLAFDGKYLWCADRLSDEIYMIDPKNGEVLMVVKSPGPYPRGLTWDGKYLWNVDYQNDKIYKLIWRDDTPFKLENTRKARIVLTHQVNATGEGKIKELNIYLAIPEDLPQQKILAQKFEPASSLTVTDKWDQKFVHYQYQNVPSNKEINSIMTIEAEISEINYFIFPDKCGKLEDIPKKIREKYTQNGSKYLINDPYIQELVQKVVGDEKNPYWIARKIFNYVRNTMEYKYEGGWNVAPHVLKRGTGSCSEYTFSFISLCRAAGLPARFVGSVVVRGDDASLDEMFHRWPEVYLPNYGWIPIDPQGGDKPIPKDRAKNIGHLSNRFLITTHGGGDSEYLGWYYNSYEMFTTDPQVEVNIETFGEWEPLDVED